MITLVFFFLKQRSKRNRQAFAFSEKEHEKINILIDKTHDQDPPAEPSHVSMDKIEDMRKMVSEVTGIMKDNIEKVVEREEKLSILEVITEELQASVSIKYNETNGFMQHCIHISVLGKAKEIDSIFGQDCL